MGAWTYIAPKLRGLLGEAVELEYVGRPERASPAEGYPAAHAAEQSRIVAAALETRRSREVPPTMQVAGEAKG